MKTKLNYFIALLICVLSFSSCKKEGPGALNISFTYFFGDSILKSDVKYDLNIAGTRYKFRIDVMKMYISRIKVSQASLTPVQINEVVLFNYKDASTLTTNYTLASGDYTNLSLINGLDTELNNKSPNSFAIDHPLSTSKSMYWGMVKYRFLVLEGVLYDSTGKELNGISYHTGIDLSKDKSFPISFKISEDKTAKININFDIAKVFNNTGNTIDPTKEVFTHSNPGAEYELSKKVMTNINTATTINVIQ